MILTLMYFYIEITVCVHEIYCTRSNFNIQNIFK